MRVLVVKTSSMGDVVHTLPAISDMVSAIPGIQIDWLVEKGFASIAAQHRGVSRVLPLEWRKWRKSLRDPITRQAMHEWAASMKAHRYDAIVDFQGLIKSALFSRFAEGPRLGYDWSSIREPLATLSYDRKFSVSKAGHAIDRSRQLAALALGYLLPETAPDFGMQTPVDAWRPAGPERFAVLIPCASRIEKLWLQHDWVCLAQDLIKQGLAVAVLWGSPEEKKRADDIAAATGAVVTPFLSVAQASEMLAFADVVIGLDTGLSHIAAARGRPTVGIYCDHDPGLAGLRGSGPTCSLGGKGLKPSLQAVRDAVATVQNTGTPHAS
jgi:heptosyltransferase I